MFGCILDIPPGICLQYNWSMCSAGEDLGHLCRKNQKTSAGASIPCRTISSPGTCLCLRIQWPWQNALFTPPAIGFATILA